MTLRPRIFISAVSAELKSARDLVAKTLTAMGYEPDWQDIFPTDGETIFGMLTGKLESCDAVIHLVGMRYGFEAPTPHPQYGRVSYTQFEALHAHALKKKVITIICDGPLLADGLAPESEEFAALQRTYREKVQASENVHYDAKNPDKLELVVRRLSDDLGKLRAKFNRMIVIFAAALILIGGSVAYGLRQGHHQGGETKVIIKQNEKLLAIVRELPAAISEHGGIGEKEDEETRRQRVYAELEKRNHLPPGSLARELPGFIDQLLTHKEPRPLDRAIGLFVKQDYAQAEAEALRAKDRALTAAGEPIKDAIEALRLAGRAARAQDQPARALEYFQAAAALTSHERDAMLWAGVQWELADTFLSLNRYLEAVPIYEAVLVEYRANSPVDEEMVLRLRSSLAFALTGMHNWAEAEAQYRAMLTAREKALGPNDSQTLSSRETLAVMLENQHKFPEALTERRTLLKVYMAAMTRDNLMVLNARKDLASALSAAGSFAEAEEEWRAILAVEMQSPRPEDRDTVLTRKRLGDTLYAWGKYEAAEKEYRLVVESNHGLPKDDDSIDLGHKVDLAFALLKQSKIRETREIFEAAYPIALLDPKENRHVLKRFEELRNLIEQSEKQTPLK